MYVMRATYTSLKESVCYVRVVARERSYSASLVGKIRKQIVFSLLTVTCTCTRAEGAMTWVVTVRCRSERTNSCLKVNTSVSSMRVYKTSPRFVENWFG